MSKNDKRAVLLLQVVLPVLIKKVNLSNDILYQVYAILKAGYNVTVSTEEIMELVSYSHEFSECDIVLTLSTDLVYSVISLICSEYIAHTKKIRLYLWKKLDELTPNPQIPGAKNVYKIIMEYVESKI